MSRFVGVLSCLFLVGCQFSVVTDLSTPESAIHDAVSDCYIVSNINGSPFGEDGAGYLARVAPSGEVLEAKWVDGSKDGVELNAPKGLGLSGDVLWVADVTHVRRFDRSSGKPLGSVEIPGATFLNDVAIGPGGEVFVSDTGFKAGFEESGTDAIHAIGADGSVRTVIQSTDLKHPNGLLFDDGELFMVNWVGGELVRISAAGTAYVVTKLPENQLDGLISTGDGRFVISSWAGQCLYELGRDGSGLVVHTGQLEQPADLGLDVSRGRILVPWFGKNQLTGH